MAEDMGGTSAWASDASTAHGLGDDHRDCTVGSESAKGRARPDKQCIDVGLRTGVFDIAGDRIANLLSQRHQCLTACLSRNADPGFLPVEIAQPKLHDIARTKAQAGEQEENGTIPPADRRGRIT